MDWLNLSLHNKELHTVEKSITQDNNIVEIYSVTLEQNWSVYKLFLFLLGGGGGTLRFLNECIANNIINTVDLLSVSELYKNVCEKNYGKIKLIPFHLHSFIMCVQYILENRTIFVNTMASYNDPNYIILWKVRRPFRTSLSIMFRLQYFIEIITCFNFYFISSKTMF